MSATPQDPTPRRGWIEWLEERVPLTEIFSLLSTFGLVYTPVDTRKPLRQALSDLASERVPRLTRGPRVLNVLAAILFGLQFVTGVLLAYYYRPTPEAAFESTRTIVRDLPAGWFIHQMHAWGAWLLVAVVVARLIRLFWDGLYRAPREVLWWCAVGLTWVVVQLDFTGRLLSWDSATYWSTVRGLELVFSIPIAGPVLAFLLGGRTVNEFVLIRFYVLHVIVLPLAFAALLYLTFATLRRVGLARPATHPTEETVRYRDHFYSLAMITVVLFAVLVTLGTLVPFRFEHAADPYTTPGGARPPWYMLAPYLLMHLPVPAAITGFLMLAAAIAVLLLPLWLGRGAAAAPPRRARLVGATLVGVWFVLTIVAALMERR
jgi:ubiquinol-cytochrome c reductase cytochrome b subunit